MIKQFLTRLWADSLYRNSFWLMAGSFSMAGIGFFYWLIAARLYSPEQIGLATTFLSAASLISSLAMLGFGTTLIRYLPTSDVKEKKINTAFTVVIIASLIIGLIYLLGLSYWTPKLLFIRSSIPLMLLMLLFFPVNTINGITDSVFTALREAHWVFVSNITQSLTKLVVLVIFASLGVWGVIGSNMVAVLVATILCLFLIISRFKIHLYPLIDKPVLLLVRKFAFGNYLSGLIGTLPGMILPIIITNRLSPEQTAYFFMPNMIGALLNVIPSSMSRSYFSESADKVGVLPFRKPLLVSYSILLPIIVIIILFGRSILSVFGKNYASEGYLFLICVAVSVVVSVLSYFYNYRMLVRNMLHQIIYTQLLSGIVYLYLVYYLSYMGIFGVGVALLISRIVELVYLYISDKKIS